MPYDIVLNQLPAGVALQNASGKEDTLIKVAVREFTSSEDGEAFITRLEGIPQLLLTLAAPEIHPSDVKHLVATIRTDKTARVWINECRVIAHVRVNRAIKKDEILTDGDIVDIDSMEFEGVEIPPDSAVVCLFSVGWRRALYFDLGPVGPGAPRRDYDLSKVLGSYMAYLHGRGVPKLAEDDWSYLIGRQWFPFVSLPAQLRSKLVVFAKAREDVDRLLPEATASVRGTLSAMLERWRRSELFRPHIGFFEHAAKRFEEGDHVSCTAIIYPRIEGLMRTVHLAVGATGKATQKNLTDAVIDAREAEHHDFSLLSPDTFRRYLTDAYFASFEPGKNASLSRHSVGHGVATIEQFNEKGATLGFLILDQLFFFLPGTEA
jgi:hypothetical protein